MKSFYYTFNQEPGPHRVSVQEKGTMASYWAVKTGKGGVKQYALAHRSGLGRVALLHTTDVEVGPGRFTLITKGHSSRQPGPIQLQCFESNVVILTETQRSPEWFLLRKFRITGTGAFALWKHLAKDTITTAEIHHDIATIIDTFGISAYTESVQEEKGHNKLYGTHAYQFAGCRFEEDLPFKETSH
jgi:hypothetical protein